MNNQENIRNRVLSLIESEFESDAAFERAMSLKTKTVNNWRRGRSASYMRILPALSEKFGVNIGELMDIPLRRDTSELSDEELHLLHLYRRARTMPLETTINLYITAATEQKAAKKRAAAKKEKAKEA